MDTQKDILNGISYFQDKHFRIFFQSVFGLAQICPTCYTVGEMLEKAQDEDIKDALYEAGVSYRSTRSPDVDAVKQAIDKGEPLEDVIINIVSEVARAISKSR